MNNPASALLRQIFCERRVDFRVDVATRESRNYSPQSCVELLVTSGANTQHQFCSTDYAALNTEATIQQASLSSMEDGSTHVNAQGASAPPPQKQQKTQH